MADTPRLSEEFRRAGAYARAFGAEVTRAVHNALAKVRNITQANFDLGMYHLEQGNVQDAILRFKFITSLLDPRYAPAWVQLGLAYARRGEFAKARAAIGRAQGLQPGADANAALDEVRAIEAAAAMAPRP